jgi:hypothetical protein
MKMELMVKTLAANVQTYINNYVLQEGEDGEDDTKTDGDNATG